MAGSHFEHMADEYASARPPYPSEIFQLLRSEGVIGPGLRVLEVGAGTGLATHQLVASGSQVVALEPGADLCSLLAAAVPSAEVVQSSLEDASLPVAGFDSVVAATSMHWVDLDVGLPKLHSTLRPKGLLAVFRTIFGDDSIDTDFRDRVRQIVSMRAPNADSSFREWRPTIDELSAGGLFSLVRSERWQWSVELSSRQVASLFRTFSNWTDKEVEAVRRAADACGGTVTEHYQSVLHLLRGT